MALNVVPNAGQTLNNSRPLINGNFVSINAAFSVDHVDYGLPLAGEHKKLTLAQQAYVAPILAPTTGATEGVIFSRDSIEAPGTMGMFYQPPSKANTDKPVEFSYAIKLSPGYTILPSGIWLAWGAHASVNGNVPQTFTQLPGGKFPNACIQVNLTCAGVLGVSAAAWTIAPTGFTLAANGVSGWYYLAIGY